MSSSFEKLEKFRIPLEEIIKATNKFSSENQIGNGGFGTVYKGQLSEKWENRVAAFKRLDPNSYQVKDEFYKEVTFLSTFNHPNIISFIGYCDEANNMIIVNDYAINGSLDDHLASSDKRGRLTWAHRLEICLGAATGLMHLHSPFKNGKIVIHRDVKSENILLDGNLKAKICDFGLSRFVKKDPSDTQLITRRAGTDFYMDPVFTETRQISVNTDVYSFGIVLFEMLRGSLVYSDLLVLDDKKVYLIDLVRRVYDNHPKKLIDPDLSVDENSFKTFKEIAYECIKLDVTERPSMSMVVKKLQLAVDFHRENNSAVVTTEAVVKSLQIHGLYSESQPYEDQIEYRMNTFSKQKMLIEKHEGSLKIFAEGYLKFGLYRDGHDIVYREWAPAAAEACLFGDFNGWNRSTHKMERQMFGVWSIKISDDNQGVSVIPHNTRVKFTFKHHHDGGWIDRVPAWIKFTTSAAASTLDGVYRDPQDPGRYKFKNIRPSKPNATHIYTVHFGMSSSSEPGLKSYREPQVKSYPEPRVNSYRKFADNMLPRVKDNKYNTILLKGVMEHSHYGSFGYYVTNFFAVSSISGTPEDLKYLIDKAHEFDLRVLMDVVHSHVSSDDVYGLFGFHVGQATQDSYFQNSCHDDRRFFNYSNWEVLRFLLSNLKWWLEEFMFDGFRFHGITSMLYHQATKSTFTGEYNEYFGDSINVDAIVYMMLANVLIHNVLPGATVIADDVSVMPGLCVPVEEGGIGFNFG